MKNVNNLPPSGPARDLAVTGDDWRFQAGSGGLGSPGPANTSVNMNTSTSHKSAQQILGSLCFPSFVPSLPGAIEWK